MTANLSATEALLAQAAATSPIEVLTARLSLIATGLAAVRPMDRSLLTAGDGHAGRQLLADDRPTSPAGPGPSCAIRSSRLYRATGPAADPAALADDARGREVFADYVVTPGRGT